MKAADWVTICSAVVALASAVSAPGLEAVFPGRGAYIAGVISLAGIVAGVVIRTLNNKTGAPAPGIIANAPVLPPGTAVVPDIGNHPTVISSSSNLLPANQAAKGPNP